jgi:PTS system mannose-specific IIA component
VSIGWHQDAELARAEIEEAVARVDRGAGVLVLTDMFGGTPSNLAMSLLSRDKVEVLTGVNLPMLIKLVNLTEQADLLTAAREMREHGRHAIWVASDLLRGQGT